MSEYLTGPPLPVEPTPATSPAPAGTGAGRGPVRQPTMPQPVDPRPRNHLAWIVGIGFALVLALAAIGALQDNVESNFDKVSDELNGGTSSVPLGSTPFEKDNGASGDDINSSEKCNAAWSQLDSSARSQMESKSQFMQICTSEFFEDYMKYAN